MATAAVAVVVGAMPSVIFTRRGVELIADAEEPGFSPENTQYLTRRDNWQAQPRGRILAERVRIALCAAALPAGGTSRGKKEERAMDAITSGYSSFVVRQISAFTSPGVAPVKRVQDTAAPARSQETSYLKRVAQVLQK